MKNLKNGEKLQPHLLWKNFDRILGVPHPSNYSGSKPLKMEVEI
jgi:hypothetical protein